jgi:hypothetical protein
MHCHYDAETEYMVTSGDTQAHQNSGYCFDYGNVETDDKDDGAATMEAIYFGGGAGWGHGGGTGNTSVPYLYVTAILIGRTGDVRPHGWEFPKRQPYNYV